MATLDIFNDDAFSVSSLSSTITDIPDVPTKLGDKGLFEEQGIRTTVFMIERQGSSIKVLPTAPRGGVREPVALGPRKVLPLEVFHIPASWSVLADEVQGIRTFGSETEVMQVEDLVRQKLAVVRASMDLTHENMRVGALKGLVKDADGSTLLDIYSAFGMTQQTQFWNMIIAANADPVQSTFDLKEMIRAKLGGRSFRKVRAIVSLGFFMKLVTSTAMKKAYDRWQEGKFLRTDNTSADFEFNDVIFEIYSGGTSTGDFIEDGYGYAYPEGVAGLFKTKYAPGDYMSTVNTNGLPFYASQERMKHDKGIDGEAQSNPLHYCELPETVIKLSTAAS
jgi:hypothetical protein